MTAILRFSTTSGFGSDIIRYATWSPYSHVDLVLEDRQLLGATTEHGVSQRFTGSTLRTAYFRIDAPYRALREKLQSQLGKGYDWWGLFGMASRSDRFHMKAKWFCSELIAWACAEVGHPLIRATKFHRITPRDLLLSPKLQRLPFSAIFDIKNYA